MKHYLWLVAVVLLFCAGGARANDQILTVVSIPTGQPTAVIIGNQTSGTIQLWYSHVGTSYPCGDFAQFNLALQNLGGGGFDYAQYPIGLWLVPTYPTPVFVSANPYDLAVTGPPSTASSLVTVSIDCNQVGTPYDGQDIVGELNLRTNRFLLDTVSTIQVHVVLSFPGGPCVKLYSFESNEDTGVLVEGVTVTAGKTGAVRASQPGAISVDGMVCNQCDEAKTFGLKIGLDSRWHTQSNGNGTFTYGYAGETDPSSYTLAMFGTGTPEGTGVCLSGVTLPAGETFLTRVKSFLNDDLNVTDLPAAFGFSASLYAAGGCTTPLDSTLVDPNPAGSRLPVTMLNQATALSPTIKK